MTYKNNKKQKEKFNDNPIINSVAFSTYYIYMCVFESTPKTHFYFDL